MSRLSLLACVLALLAVPARAQDFGRLFFTPEQRSALDERRKARIPDKPAAAVAASPTTKMNGYVKRSGGPSTVFLNGEGILDTGQPDAPRVPRGKDQSVSVPVGEGGARVELKPGEVLDSGSGEVHDVLGGGEIRVRRAPAGE
ncbi:MAG TPA: hypothetical protein VFB08_10565 [Burkholderiales bacterium]|nr:hypothetical protein [Burkholderiales bacterium]